MYASPDAVRMYSEKTRLPQELIRLSIAKYHPLAAMQTDEMKDLDGIVRDAVKLKYIDRPLTGAQLAELVAIPPR
jgi:NitT/TauT family transport system substrate-binding protein